MVQTMQNEIKNEFDNLIKEISLEVMELSVSKAMIDAAHTVQLQIPEIEKYIVDLNSVAMKLSTLRKQLDGQVNEVKENYVYFANEVKDSTKKVDVLSGDVKNTLETIVGYRKELEGFCKESTGYYEDLEQSILAFESKSNGNYLQMLEELKEVISTLDEDSLIAKRRGKIQLTIMFFSMGSFLALCYLIYSQL